MSLDEKFIPELFYETVGNFFKKTAGLLGYLIIRNAPPIFQVKFILDRNFLITYRVIELLASNSATWNVVWNDIWSIT
jgi:hypothetical protein